MLGRGMQTTIPSFIQQFGKNIFTKCDKVSTFKMLSTMFLKFYDVYIDDNVYQHYTLLHWFWRT